MTSEAIGMDEAQNVLSTNGVEAVWDGSVGQNYATFEQDNSTYQIWLEDAQSIAEKVKDVYKRQVEATPKNLNDLKLQKANAEKVAQENLEAAQAFAKDLETKEDVYKRQG